MCCLFGLIDCQGSLSFKEKNHILSVLAAACEARGTDATGIAYNDAGSLCIYKRPVPGHKVRFHVPGTAKVVMGHTRMATQGNPKRNRNNHPFLGRTADGPFALAHNGVLYNDQELRRIHHLSQTKIQTDSYISVQLIEQKKTLDFSSLKHMAEQVEGSFTFTVLDQQDNLYLVKGDNPLCIYYYPRRGLYLYASTETILVDALSRIHCKLGKSHQIKVDCGEIVCLTPEGTESRSRFTMRTLPVRWRFPYSYMLEPPSKRCCISFDPASNEEYIRSLKSIASFYGYSPEYIDMLLEEGFTTDELEELIYCGGF